MLITPLLVFPLFANLISCYQEYIAVGGGNKDLYIECDDLKCYGTKDRSKATRFKVLPSTSEFHHFQLPGTDKCLNLGYTPGEFGGPQFKNVHRQRPMIISDCRQSVQFTIQGLSDNGKYPENPLNAVAAVMCGEDPVALSITGDCETFRRPWWTGEGKQLETMASVECTALHWQCFHWHAEKV